MDRPDAPVPGSFAELHARLGSVPLDRILAAPPPGTATEAHLLAAWQGPVHHRCELVDGVLIQKYGSFFGSVLVGVFCGKVGNHVERTDAGVALMGNVPFRLRPGLIRLPSFSFTPWERLSDEGVPDEEIASFVPTLVVEILNEWVTGDEIARKLTDYFEAGVKLAWVVDPRTETVAVHTETREWQVLDADGALDGWDALPGFELPVAELFHTVCRLKTMSR